MICITWGQKDPCAATLASRGACGALPCARVSPCWSGCERWVDAVVTPGPPSPPTHPASPFGGVFHLLGLTPMLVTLLASDCSSRLRGSHGHVSLSQRLEGGSASS